MNTYFLGLFSSCEKKRRESIEKFRLPNGKREGINNKCRNCTSISKMGVEVLFYEYNHLYLILRLKNITIEIESDEEGNFILSFHVPGFSFPLVYDPEIMVEDGFQSMIDTIGFDKIPFSRKNFIRRTITPTLIDSLVPESESLL
jgi:hypothetical protein